MKIQELEYRGLNLMDVIGTVEIAIDSRNKTIHMYDTEQIVVPEYHFSTKSYVLSDGFFKLAIVLKQKQFFLENNENNLTEWINLHRWIFYCPKQSIKKFENGICSVQPISPNNPSVVEQNHISEYYQKYYCRVKGE